MRRSRRASTAAPRRSLKEDGAVEKQLYPTLAVVFIEFSYRPYRFLYLKLYLTGRNSGWMPNVCSDPHRSGSMQIDCLRERELASSTQTTYTNCACAKKLDRRWTPYPSPTSRIWTCHDHALSELMRVAKYGRKIAFIESMQTFHDRKQALREAIASTDLSNEEMTPIDTAEIPREHRYNIED